MAEFLAFTDIASLPRLESNQRKRKKKQRDDLLDKGLKPKKIVVDKFLI